MRKLPSRAELNTRVQAAQDLLATADREADTAARLRSENRLGAVVEAALGLRHREGHET